MPSKTPKQARLMAACSHGAGYSSCPPMKVAKEFNRADKGSKLMSQAMKKSKTSMRHSKKDRESFFKGYR